MNKYRTQNVNHTYFCDFTVPHQGGDQIPEGTFHVNDEISLGGLGILALFAYFIFKSKSASSPVTAEQGTISQRPLLNRIESKKRFYRTSDGLADYGFSFEKQADGIWRAYIDNQPSYQGRNTDAHSTHRLSDGARKYVCWTSPLRSLEEARQVAALWADKTQQYIRTGNSF
ncbi:MAG: hypothetical protein HGB35_05790 [Geobacteraceae bacterium]|nr:hypothetical protein [Geobacteraceae bacterium]